MHRLEQQTEGTFKFLDDRLGQDCEFNVGMLVIEVLGKLGNAFGIGLGLKAESLALKQGLQFLVVRDDTVVDDGELPSRIGANSHRVISLVCREVFQLQHLPVRVAVLTRRGSVSSPTGV